MILKVLQSSIEPTRSKLRHPDDWTEITMEDWH
jgi:hypothetical protein